MDGITTSSVQFAACYILLERCLWAAEMKVASLPRTLVKWNPELGGNSYGRKRRLLRTQGKESWVRQCLDFATRQAGDEEDAKLAAQGPMAAS